MSTQHPDVTDEDIGMRAFQTKKAKAAERALERLRHGMKADWPKLSNSDIEELEWVLGELWAYVARAEWEELRFGSLTLADVWKILAHGREMRKHTRPAVDALTDVGQIISTRS